MHLVTWPIMLLALATLPIQPTSTASPWWHSKTAKATSEEKITTTETGLVPVSVPSPSVMTRLSSGISRGVYGMVHTIGAIFPLRGIASLLADVGIPGASWLMHFLTPRHTPVHSGTVSAVSPRLMAAQRRSGLFSSFASSSASGTGTSKRLHKQQYHSPLLVEINSIVGAAHGERGCLLKLACLSGKRLSALSGASAAAILLAVATDLMPEGVREPYTAMKNSVMYSDDCSQYTCSKDRSDL